MFGYSTMLVRSLRGKAIAEGARIQIITRILPDKICKSRWWVMGYTRATTNAIA
ncbi:MAG: hypothetical protein F6J92_39290 [Symploca sp. SIO1A3]|nr:hypothetical protein [Symploca sp. SIO1A3]